MYGKVDVSLKLGIICKMWAFYSFELLNEQSEEVYELKIYTFNKKHGKSVSAFESDFIISRIVQTETEAHIACMHLGVNGVIGYHQAVVPQLLLIMNGAGYVRGVDETYVKVQSGDAIFWEKHEWHETKTDTGLTAIVIESETLNPSLIEKE